MTFFGQQPAWLIAADVGVAVMLVLVFGPLGLPGRIKFLYKAELPEVDWLHRYSRTSLEGFARKVGRKGLVTYRRALGWDVLFALLLAGALVAVIDGLLARSLDRGQELLRWAVWIPAMYALFDVAEDAALLRVTNGSNLSWNGEVPDLHADGSLVWMAGAFTSLKFVFVGISLLSVVAGAVSLALFGPGS
jgi:hypothetical protein